MYICFTDESGSPPKPTAKRRDPYFIIAGVIIPEDQWATIRNEFEATKQKFKVSGEVKWRYFGPHNNDDNHSIAHLPQNERDKFREALYAIITSRKSCKIVVCKTNIEKAYLQTYVHTQEDLYKFTYKPVTERFQYFLQDISKLTGATHRGIIVADHRGRNEDETLRINHHKMIDGNGPTTSNYPNLIETIFLTPSHRSVGIQFADMIAGAIGRYYNHKEKTFAKLVEPALRRSPAGKIEGYGIVSFPK